MTAIETLESARIPGERLSQTGSGDTGRFGAALLLSAGTIGLMTIIAVTELVIEEIGDFVTQVFGVRTS